MGETSPRRMRTVDLRTPKKWTDREPSPDPIKMWRRGCAKDEPDSTTPDAEGGGGGCCGRGSPRAAVLYYLSVNGQLQHPHFIEVSLSSSQGLYLRDFINRLDQLRGKGIASIYSWSSRRRYKNGFVWQDLTEDDLISPSHRNEYVLKGSELLDLSPPSCISSYPALSISGSPIASSPSDHSNSKAVSRRRNQSLSSIDSRKYRAERTEWMGESTPPRTAADASTQTGDCTRRSHTSASIQEEDLKDSGVQLELQGRDGPQLQPGEELSKEDVSPPPLVSSPETLVTLMKSHRPLMLYPATEGGADSPGGRPRASSLLLHFISCGALPFKDCGPTSYPRRDLIDRAW